MPLWPRLMHIISMSFLLQTGRPLWKTNKQTNKQVVRQTDKPSEHRLTTTQNIQILNCLLGQFFHCNMPWSVLRDADGAWNYVCICACIMIALSTLLCKVWQLDAATFHYSTSPWCVIRNISWTLPCRPTIHTVSLFRALDTLRATRCRKTVTTNKVTKRNDIVKKRYHIRYTWLNPFIAPLAATLDDTWGLMTPSRCWYHQRDAPHSATGFSLRRPPEPGMHCRPASDQHRRLPFSAVNLFCVSFPEQYNWLLLFWFDVSRTIFYRILYCFILLYSGPACDSATLNIYFCNNNNNNNN